MTRKSPAQTRRDQRAQRLEAIARSSGLCEFEKKMPGYRTWIRCTRRGTQAAHILRRTDCAGARDLADVILWACEDCHRFYDDPIYAPPGWVVRCPPAAYARALEKIEAHSKVPPTYLHPPPE